MLHTTAVLLATLLPIVAAWSNDTHFLDPSTNEVIKHFNCDVHLGKASTHFNQTLKALYSHRWSGSLSSRAVLSQRQLTSQPIQVQTYFHVITKNASAGTITPGMVASQLQQLNSAYAPTGISFRLINTSYTANDAWAVAAGADMATLKSALRAGSYSALNLYFHTDLADGVIGTCTLPAAVPAGAPRALFAADGCNVLAATMPGGALRGYNMGGTAVHEVGHWLGLLHTFEGAACAGPGDYVADTPPEALATAGCPAAAPPKDSCPAVSAADPIHNYMDYSSDACYEMFTPGQALRMAAMWKQYRAGM